MVQPIELCEMADDLRRRIVRFDFGFFASLLLFLTPSIMAQAPNNSRQVVHEARKLKLGESVEQVLAGGETHLFQIKLKKNEYLQATVEQRSIDVGVTLIGPDGKPVGKSDSFISGTELIMAVAEAAGIHCLEVSSSVDPNTAGRYEVKIEALRKATPEDTTRVAAWKAAKRLFAEAAKLDEKGTPESRRQAIEKFKAAALLFKLANDQHREIYTLSRLGSAYQLLGEYQNAMAYYNQVLPYWQACGNYQMEGATLSGLGQSQVMTGLLKDGRDNLLRSLPLLRKGEDRYIEAATFIAIGAACAMSFEMQKATDYYEQALRLWRAVGDSFGVASTLSPLAAIYQYLGQTDRAKECLRQAKVINDGEVGYPWQASPEEKHRVAAGQAYTQGQQFWVKGTPESRRQAIAHFEEALQHWRAIGDSNMVANVLNAVGAGYSMIGDKKKALDYLGKALALSEAAGDRHWKAFVLGNIGETCLLQGEPQKAFNYLAEALALAREFGERGLELSALFRMARAERDLEHLFEARSHIEAALAIIESLRTQFLSQTLRTTSFEKMQESYQLGIDVLMRLHQRELAAGHEAAAFYTSERARARSFLDLLGEAGVDIRQGVDTVLIARERSLQQQLNLKEQRRLQWLNSKHTEAQLDSAQREIATILTQLEEVETQIRTASPRYAALTQPQPLRLKEIQEQVLDDDTMLLEYALGEERSFLWAVTPTRINSFELPKRAKIDSLARRVYALLTAPNECIEGETTAQKLSRIASAKAKHPEAAAELSRMLLEPVASQLGTKRLLVVADGALQYIPFAALPVPVISNQLSVISGQKKPNTDYWPLNTAFRPLISEHEIVSLPSASVLAVLRRELAERRPAPKMLAVVADPVFAASDPRLKRFKRKVSMHAIQQNTQIDNEKSSGQEFKRAMRAFGACDDSVRLERLHFSGMEAEGIAALAPPQDRMKALGFAANRAMATSAELSRYRLVHFATHGLLDAVHPELSGIALSLVDEKGESQDGFLRLHEIYNLDLPAELVVLSACQTALGKDIKGEGLVGLTRGFMYAGAARLVASLWNVDDAATAELMKRFYEKMLGNEKLRPAAALREAQLSIQQEQRWQSPYYWAAFVLQGEWR